MNVGKKETHYTGCLFLSNFYFLVGISTLETFSGCQYGYFNLFQRSFLTCILTTGNPFIFSKHFFIFLKYLMGGGSPSPPMFTIWPVSAFSKEKLPYFANKTVQGLNCRNCFFLQKHCNLRSSHLLRS